VQGLAALEEVAPVESLAALAAPASYFQLVAGESGVGCDVSVCHIKCLVQHFQTTTWPLPLPKHQCMCRSLMPAVTCPPKPYKSACG
jgi:hypothetical protein